jgi:hypothetical protein
MPSTSKSQQRFFQLVRAVQEGKVAKNAVSKAILKAAQTISPADAKEFASRVVSKGRARGRRRAR